MKELIIKIFGEYVPITTPVTGSDGLTTIVSGVAGVDWVWMAGVLLFSICLLSFFRLLTSVVRGH